MTGTRRTRHVFVAGGTGYLGRAVIPVLQRRGHRVRALVRRGSERRLPPGCEAVVGDALDHATFASLVAPADTMLQLVGTPSPSPARAAEFERVDFVSARESLRAAAAAGVRHFVYVSVAQPAPIMRAYVDVRARCESLVQANGLPASILRPWYVLGPGHRWPYLLLPAYAVLHLLPSTRATARRLDLITRATMVDALLAAIESPPPDGVRVWDVPTMRQMARAMRAGK
jgi:uncharacterized protein YbjT (DUF2867 family)